jgi:hypothetical protein
MYYAVCNLDAFFSRDKRKVRKWVKRARFFGMCKVSFGFVPRQAFSSPEKYKKEFGLCHIYDIDQRLNFRHDFSVVGGF